MHTPKTSEQPRWLRFYDLAMTCGAFQARPSAPSGRSEPETPTEYETAASGGLPTLSAVTLPASAVAYLESFLRI